MSISHNQKESIRETCILSHLLGIWRNLPTRTLAARTTIANAPPKNLKKTVLLCAVIAEMTYPELNNHGAPGDLLFFATDH